MVKVHLWASLRVFADGHDVVEVEATTVGGMLDALAHAYPGLADIVEEGVSVSVNGRIIASALNEEIPEGAEVYLMQRLRGIR